MGALYKDQCFPDTTAALDAMYTGSPIQIQPGVTTYATRFEKVLGVWYSRGYEVQANGYWNMRYSTVAPGYNFPECSPSQNYVDGITIGWGIVTAMVLAAAIMNLRQGAK